MPPPSPYEHYVAFGVRRRPIKHGTKRGLAPGVPTNGDGHVSGQRRHVHGRERHFGAGQRPTTGARIAEGLGYEPHPDWTAEWTTTDDAMTTPSRRITYTPPPKSRG